MEKDARKAAGEERTGLKREANDAAEEILNNTRKETALIRDEVIKEVEAQVQKAQEFVHHEALALADTITEKLIDRRIDL
jgi:F0F1-type ATP synthase membrane subunit b/b'